jgi:hypothetical protein
MAESASTLPAAPQVAPPAPPPSAGVEKPETQPPAPKQPPLTARQKLEEQMKKLAAEKKDPPKPPEKTPEVQAAETKDRERRADAIARARRKEAEVLAKEQAFKAEQEKFKTQNADLYRKAQVHDALAKTVQEKNVLEYLRLGGFTGEDAAKAMLKPDQRTPDEIFTERENKLRSELKAEREALDKQAAAKAQSDFEAKQIQSTKATLKELIESDAEKYEFLNAHPGAVDEIWNFIQEHFNATFDKSTGRGEVYDFSKAVDLAEKALEEQELQRHKTSKKIQAALALEKQASAPAQNAASSTKSGSAQTTVAPPTSVAPPRPKPKAYNLSEHISQLKQKLQARQDT